MIEQGTGSPNPSIGFPNQFYRLPEFKTDRKEGREIISIAAYINEIYKSVNISSQIKS